MVKATHKIAVIVTAQIILIIASFLVMVYFESQAYHTGNIVNVAGKNRVLAILVHSELIDEILDYGQIHDGGKTMLALDDLRNNILFLRDGGAMSGIESTSLPQQFHGEWSIIWDKFSQYESMVVGLISDGKIPSDDINHTVVLSEIDIDGIKHTGGELVTLSDILTDKLGRDVDVHFSILILIQVILGIINVTVHIFMIILIWKIFNRHAEQKIRMEKFAMMGEFAATMAHNMKNPLGTILNSITLIRHRTSKDNNYDETIGIASKKIERAIKQMSHQIDGVMNYVRDVPFVGTISSVHDILRRSIDMVSVPSNIHIVIPENDAHITCDPDKMEIVFANLLQNAIHAIGNSKGHIIIRLTKNSDNDTSIILVFENSGLAIPEKNTQAIFEPLFTTKMSGTGLGLASCKNIMNQHGGSITVSNNPVRFVLHIPCGIAGVKNERNRRHEGV
ncbi:MAG: HAMP domain-containing sensor histidine kinase [Thaumarchaeota archaeon]|nr:HAMP domain-containing sensor histidine kinase [Nitrososphaerota archaeon]